MPASKFLLRIQAIVADSRFRWAHDPQLWIELFVTTNLAILAADIYIAHSVNHFQKAAEYIPLYFSIGAPVVLVVMIGLRWMWKFEAPWRDVGYMVGWLSVLVGLGGVLYHLESRFFLDRTLKSLTYAAPFRRAAGIHWTGIFPSVNRMVGPAQRRVGALGDLSGPGRLLRKFCFVVDRPCVEWLLCKDGMDPCYLLCVCDRLSDRSSCADGDKTIHGCLPDCDADAGLGRRTWILVSHSGKSC